MRHLLAVAGLALALPCSAQAQAYDWRPVDEQTATSLHAGDNDTALPIIQDALTKCPQAVTPVEAGLCTANFSEHLGMVREHQGNIPAAEEAFREALASRTTVLPVNDPGIGHAHFVLAAFFQRQNRPTDEVTELQAAEAIARANGPDHRTELAGLLTRHAQALDALDRQAEALPLYEEAYTLTRQTGGPTARDTLIALGNLFSAKANAGVSNAEMDTIAALLASPDATAIDPTQRALLAGKLAQDVMGPDQARSALASAETALPDLDNGLVVDPDASFVLLRGAARLNAAIGDSTRAVDLARRARAIAAAKWGPTSYPVSNALRTEAEADIARHDLRAAIARLSDAAAMLNTPQLALPRTQVEVARAALLARTGHQADAVANDQALIADPIVTMATPAIQAAVLVLLGEDLNRMAAFEPGGKACAQSAERGASQPALSRDYRVRAVLCAGNAALGEGHPDRTLDAAQRAQSVLWDGLKAPAEPSRILQFQVTDLRAQALRDLHRSIEALAAYRDELTVAQQLGDISAQGTVMAQIAFVQRQMGLYKACDDTSVAGLKLLGPNGPPRPRANLLNNRAQVAVAENRPADAVPFFEAALALRRSEAVSDSLSIAAEERDLAAALASIGRNIEAGQHMDAAIGLFQALGPARKPFLAVALDRRVAIAMAAGDLARAESALRALLPLQDPASDAAAGVRLTLAGVMDNQARRKEASALRAEAMAIVVAKDGVNSPQALRIGLNEQASLRASGRLREAASAARDCADRAASMPDVLLSCQLARTETALDGGNLRDAATRADKAVIEAETHWTNNTATLLQALMLRSRVAAAMGDADTVLRLYDRVHGLTPEKGSSRGWTDLGEGRMLIQSGALDIGLTMIRQALQQANNLHDTGLAVAATGALAQHDLDTGKGREAISLWVAVLPLLSDDAPAHRVTVLKGLGAAANAIAHYYDAARLCGEAVSLSRTVMGAGSAVYQQAVVAWSEALVRSGQPGQAEQALALLDADSSPAAQRQHRIGLIHLAQEERDPVAAVVLARQMAATAEAAYGVNSVAAAYAGLDLLQILLTTNKHVDQADLDSALGIIGAQDSSWHLALRAARLQGSLAAHSGRLDEAMAAFQRAETIARKNQGADSLATISALSNEASVRLRAGDAAGADKLFRQALLMAAPGGDWRNPVWAGIATNAAVAAERTGDTQRATKLRHDAEELIPNIPARELLRWS